MCATRPLCTGPQGFPSQAAGVYNRDRARVPIGEYSLRSEPNSLTGRSSGVVREVRRPGR